MFGMLLFQGESQSWPQIMATSPDRGYIPSEAFRRLFDELHKDRINQHPPLPEYQSKFLQNVQFIISQHYVIVVGNAVALANDVSTCTVNCFFILYYLLEMLLKMVPFGWKGRVS
ncbi:two pore calcium channel protein 2-like [Salmo trutta]|uniref:two pore calcium channel protein 2-like n=1 Tax=Salmo trutta TaxID=8032 RepID=UPI0011314DD1|nr:two pore calcium channel protein 2-like [Salmo trutta]